MRPLIFLIFYIKIPQLIENKIMRLSNNSKFNKSVNCNYSTLQKMSYIKNCSLQKSLLSVNNYLPTRNYYIVNEKNKIIYTILC